MAVTTVNFGTFADWSNKIGNKNDDLKRILEDIKKTIKSTAENSVYLSDSGNRIREKIEGMQSRFDSYYKVVDSYKNFIKTTADAYRATEDMNVGQANKFI